MEAARLALQTSTGVVGGQLRLRPPPWAHGDADQASMPMVGTDQPFREIHSADGSALCRARIRLLCAARQRREGTRRERVVQAGRAGGTGLPPSRGCAYDADRPTPLGRRTSSHRTCCSRTAACSNCATLALRAPAPIRRKTRRSPHTWCGRGGVRRTEAHTQAPKASTRAGACAMRSRRTACPAASSGSEVRARLGVRAALAGDPLVQGARGWVAGNGGRNWERGSSQPCQGRAPRQQATRARQRRSGPPLGSRQPQRLLQPRLSCVAPRPASPHALAAAADADAAAVRLCVAVLVGDTYGPPVDVWALGCIFAEVRIDRVAE
jgi:hypothetical protein